MNMRVLLSGQWNPEEVKMLTRKLDSGIDLLTDAEEGDFHVIVDGRPSKELIASSRALKSLIIPWAGVPAATLELMRNNAHISVHNIHHNATSASELAMGLMFAAARRIVQADRRLRVNDWSSRLLQEKSVLVSGSSVLILGFGHIGKAIGRACSAMGAQVKGIRRNAGKNESQGEFKVYPPSLIHNLLEKTDILFLALPLTEETRGIIGCRELELLHCRSILVNIGRGDLVVEEALFNSLKGNTIGAAGIDVWYNYPENRDSYSSTPPSKYPFAELENVVMTPHIGGAFGLNDLEQFRMEHLARSLNCAASGLPIPCEVDLVAGY